MSKKRDMSLVPYCGIRNPPKNRVRGTSQQCINSDQARYYGIIAVEDSINKFLADKKKLANEKAKIKRQNANDKKKDAVIKIKQANQAVKQSDKAEQEAKTAEQKAKKPGGRPRGRPKKNTTTTTAKNTSAKKFPILEKFVKEEEKRRKIKNI